MAVVLTAALVLPFTAHTVTELEAWQADWNSRAMHSLDVEMMTERREMRARHAWFFDPQPEEVTTAGRNRPSVAAPPPTVWPSDWAALVAAYFLPEDVDAALRVIQCESRFSLTAKNPISSALGPWQFLRDTWDRMVAPNTGSPSYDTGAPTDPVWSTINAAWLWYNVGPSQWSCY